MPRSAPPKSVQLLLPPPTSSASSSSTPAPTRRVLKAASELAKKKRKILDVESLAPGSSRPGSSSKRSVKGVAKEQADENGVEETELDRSQSSTSYWNHLLIEARRSRGPQWDFSTQIYLVDSGSHYYYSQGHLPEPELKASASTLPPQGAQAHPSLPPQRAPPTQYQSQNAPFGGTSLHEVQAQQAQLLLQRQQMNAQQQSQPHMGLPQGFPNVPPEQVAMYRQQFLQQQQAMQAQMNGGRQSQPPAQYFAQQQQQQQQQKQASMYTSAPLRPGQLQLQQQQQSPGMRPGGMSGMMLGGQQQSWQPSQAR